eukprot:CAMPEP_0203767396 /NCGR_PEP_ID=MMETSP0099_2-20121227/975_1 /ASSEMBLY_ACC=CAM_ASM_000209 /TAXON_ID=96639 /ORGANISM=" , Strain NY0313808BC1" /LENGTH=73 /DNA_ID=CAMNT_0050663903 /DNA_START=758 /DNA_END=979 /DNA_ORIENTATION=-
MDYVRELLGERVRVTLSDGRVMDGTFECTDYMMNMIVRDQELGLVMIPGKYFEKCERYDGGLRVGGEKSVVLK